MCSTETYHDQEFILIFPFFFFSKDGSCNGLQHYAALGRDKVNSFCSRWLEKIAKHLPILNLEIWNFLDFASRFINFSYTTYTLPEPCFKCFWMHNYDQGFLIFVWIGSITCSSAWCDFVVLLLCFTLSNKLNWTFNQLGAAAVNLVGGGKPADVYSGIAARWALSLTASLWKLGWG
jgi:hypothetical protein